MPGAPHAAFGGVDRDAGGITRSMSEHSATATLFMLASAGVILALGVMHLWFTFTGNKLTPRDAALQARMREISPVLTRETSMWNAWVGFNASHSMGAILFGLIYGYLALMQGALLFQSAFLLAVGFLMLGGLALIAKRYWFSAPFRGICVALACYVAAVVLARV
jgi:hypothetical protein